MGRKSFAPRRKSVVNVSVSEGGGGGGAFDWVISILLVAVIIALAFVVCSNPGRDSTADGGGFAWPWSSSAETFSNAGAAATKVTSVEHLENSVSGTEIGCCLVHYGQCGHCQTYKPVWDGICRDVNGTQAHGRTIRMFECGDADDKAVWRSVSERHGVQGYPTILVKIGGNGARWNEYTGSRNQLASYFQTAAN
jgi:hypothetical protein